MQLPNQVWVCAWYLLHAISLKRVYTSSWHAGQFFIIQDDHLTENKPNVQDLKTTSISRKLIFGLGLRKDVEVNAKDLMTIDSDVSLFCDLFTKDVHPKVEEAMHQLLEENNVGKGDCNVFKGLIGLTEEIAYQSSLKGKSQNFQFWKSLAKKSKRNPKLGFEVKFTQTFMEEIPL